MDFVTMLDEYRKFANLSPEEKAEQTVEQFFVMKDSETKIARAVCRLTYLFSSLSMLLVKKGLLEESEFDSEIKSAVARANEEFEKTLADEKAKLKSEILAELEKTE